MIDLVLLQAQFDAWPAPAVAAAVAQTPRLAAVLSAAAGDDCLSGDLAGLVRDAIRQWQEENEQETLPSPVNVPATAPWPTQDQWSAFGVQTAPGATASKLRIVAVRAWRPRWIDCAEAVDAYPASRTRRRVEDATAGDPVWTYATGLPAYRSLEQREAVRAVIGSAPDATVLILLPTGSGKSLVGTLQAMTIGPGATTVVVVPTTSLAIDQEEQLRGHLRDIHASDSEEAFAFYGGLDLSKRLAILDRVRNGGQRVVFTSPEALFGSLGEALMAAAQAGRLGQFVIDEAHIVASWGAEFRPDFQALAGLRRRLRSVAAENGYMFRTLLLTATATQTDVETLAALFTEEGQQLAVGGAAALRPELAYLAGRAPDAEHRWEYLAEAVRHLPRPMFVYTTRVEDAADTEAFIRSLGIGRVVSVTGDTSDEGRRAAVESLRGSAATPIRADIAVATSAFGLGIDVNDVRVVVHACLPETIDRYYQEVGRGGRDGRAALGLLLWAPSDVAIAKSVGQVKLITVGMARQYWSGMMARAETRDGLVWIPLDALRIGLIEHNEETERWNSRTLSSMARARFIQLVGTTRTEDRDRLIAIRTLRDDLGADQTWNEFQQMRERTYQAIDERLNAVLDVARTGEVCGKLEALYTVVAPAVTAQVIAANYACGGCAACGPGHPAPAPPLPIRQAPRTPTPAPCLEHLVDADGSVVALADADSPWKRNYGRLLTATHRAGVRNLVCSTTVAESRDIRLALEDIVRRSGLDAPLLTSLREVLDDPGLVPDVPTLLLIDPVTPESRAFDAIATVGQPTVGVLPSDYRSTERDDMSIAQLRPGAPRVPDLIRRIEQCSS